MRFVDLFAGLGGFHLAAAELGGFCVFACEIEPKLRKLYKENFGVEPEGDIRELDIHSIPSHELLCAGFPCQPFSKAGDQLGWKDAVRGTVFENIVEILSYHRPKYLILENVAHFVRHDEGNTYRKVRQALEELGYAVDSLQLSPHKFGVPQIRERMYMVGSLGGLKNFVWPEQTTESKNLSIKDVLDSKPRDAVSLSRQVVECLEVWQEFIQTFPGDEQLPSFPVWSMEFSATYPYDRDSLFDYRVEELRHLSGSLGASLSFESIEGLLSSVPSHARAKKGSFPKWKKTFIRQNRELYSKHRSWIDPWLPKIKRFPPSLQKLEWNCKGEERDIWKYVIQFRASGVRVKRPTTSPSLVAMTSTQVPIIAWEKRYMTIRECTRLQSMDKLKHLPEGVLGRSALGNAVNVKVVQLILHNLLKSE